MRCSLPLDWYDWSDLKEDFSLVLANWRGEPVDDVELEKALVRIQARGLTTASHLLRCWHIANAETEAGDVVQQWNVKMLLTVFARCDEQKSVHAFAYRVLRRCCIDVVKREATRRFEALEFEVEDKRADSSAALRDQQIVQALQHAILGLPRNLRIAVEQWIDHRRRKVRMVFANQKARRQFHNRMYLARRRLAEILAPHLDDFRESQEFARVA